MRVGGLTVVFETGLPSAYASMDMMHMTQRHWFAGSVTQTAPLDVPVGVQPSSVIAGTGVITIALLSFMGFSPKDIEIGYVDLSTSLFNGKQSKTFSVKVVSGVRLETARM